MTLFINRVLAADTQGRRLCEESGRHLSNVICGSLGFCQQPQEVRRGNREFFPRTTRKSTDLPTPSFQTSSVQNCERVNFPCFKPLSLWSLLQQPKETNTPTFYHFTITRKLKPFWSPHSQANMSIFQIKVSYLSYYFYILLTRIKLYYCFTRLPLFLMSLLHNTIFISVQSLNHVRIFAIPQTAARQASLSFTNSRSLLKFMSIESVMPSNHLILCRPLLLLPSIFPSIRVFSNESVPCIRCPKYWSFSFTISPSNEYSGLISFRMDSWISLLFKGLSRVFSNITVQNRQFFST